MTRSLLELGATADGRELLEEHGVYSDPDVFRSLLHPPARPELAERLGLPSGTSLVYVGQQVATDYVHATAAKFEAARDLEGGEARCAMIWHDMDRAGSDRYGLRIVLNLAGKTVGLGLADRKLEEREPRFIPFERERVPEVLRQARNATDGLTRAARVQAREKLDGLEVVLDDEQIETLAQATRAIATWLLREHLRVELVSLCVSDLAEEGLLRQGLVEVLERVDEVVAAFNGAVARLEQQGVDAQVHPLDDRWLPLWYSCPVTGRRLRLGREVSGSGVLAVSDCRCGELHRFDLGAGADLGELEATGRWSPDVLLPVVTDALASGYIAGRSTALYGLVMRDVIRALGREPTPALVPVVLTGAGAVGSPYDSLLNEYLAT